MRNVYLKKFWFVEQEFDMEQQRNVIIADRLDDIGTNEYKEYLGHVLCLGGSCSIVWAGTEMEMKRGDLHLDIFLRYSFDDRSKSRLLHDYRNTRKVRRTCVLC